MSEKTERFHVANAQSAVSIGVYQKEGWATKVYFCICDVYAGGRNQCVFTIYHEHENGGHIVIETTGADDTKEACLKHIKQWLNVPEEEERIEHDWFRRGVGDPEDERGKEVPKGD